MADDRTRDAAFALHRFGLGPRPGSIAAIASDPRGALLAELDVRAPAASTIRELMTSAQSSRAGFEARAARQRPEHRRRARQERSRAHGASARRRHERGGRQDGGSRQDAAAAPQAGQTPTPERQIFPEGGESAARRRARWPRSALPSVWFGSGRTISASRHSWCPTWPAATSAKRSARIFSGALPICCSPPKAIRRCWSISTTRCPSGPNSVAGINRTRGLNENLAREILELHTLGVRTGYTQVDVRVSPKCSPAGPSSRPTTIPSTARSSSSTSACTSPGLSR